jgi:capsular exopolysaccharide synthesis family protein
MSRYFEETLKSNDSVGTRHPTPWMSADRVSEKTKTTPSPSSTVCLRNSQRPSIELSTAVREQYTQCDDLGTFQESFHLLRTRLSRLQAKQGLRSVVVTSSTKGEGKSTVALNLAFTCAQLPEMNVLLIDADIRGCGLSQILDVPKGPTLPEVLLQKAEPDEVILATDVPNLYLLPCALTPIPAAELLASRRWSELIASCKRTFSLVIVDAPPILNLTDVDLISGPCDGVILVARSQETRTDFIQKASRQIDLKKLVGVVLNGTAAGLDTYSYSYGYAKPPESVPRFTSPIAIVSHLLGFNDGNKHEDGRSAAVVPAQTHTETSNSPLDATSESNSSMVPTNGQ